jgi:hypothetical protein
MAWHGMAWQGMASLECPDYLQEEGVQDLEPLAPTSFQETLNQTLLCFVLVNPQGEHHFCSRYDFGPWPLLPGVDSLPPGVLKVYFCKAW